MFKATRWWSEKNKIRVDFKLRFHASELIGEDELIVSLVPGDSSKPTVKSDKATVRNGSCVWENPVYETVKFTQDTKTGLFEKRMYCFVVGTTGSSKTGVFGEGLIDFSDYAEKNKVSVVSLPLKDSKTGATLHVSIERIHEAADGSYREAEEIENVKLDSVDPAMNLKTDINGDADETEVNIDHRISSESDVTLSSSEMSLGVEASWEVKEVHGRSWDWLNNSVRDDSLKTDPNEESEVIEKLKSEVVALTRQAGVSELELQALRKQVVKESKMRQNLWMEIESLKQEKDASNGYLDSNAVIEELKEELHHAKEMNANLEIQLRKTQESNSELILAVQDLDEMLEKKNRFSNDDEEQKELEELVKEHGNDGGEEYLLDQQIIDMRSEIEFCRRDKEEMEIQMEQLALDYEIMKQLNHELENKLQQSQIQEQLKIQYECSSSDSGVNDLESQIESLEDELKRRSEEYMSSLEMKRALEEELEKQARGFEGDLEALSVAKIEQEKRAIRAEEMLKKMRWKNANMADRIQEEFKRLSMQMESTFESNEKLATKAMAEANELRLQKRHIEDMLRIACEEKDSMEKQMEKMRLDIEEKEGELENLRDEIETEVAKNKILVEEVESKKDLIREIELMKISVKEKELLVEQCSDERIELERRVVLVKNEAEESIEELNKTRVLVKEKESVVENIQSELDSVRSECRKLEGSRSESEVEKEKLKKQMLQLRNELKKKEEALSCMEKKAKECNVAKPTTKANKPNPRSTKEMTSLKDRIKLLESQIKSKETDHETSATTFLQTEIDLRNKIEELEGRLQVYQQIEKPAEDHRSSEVAGNGDKESEDLSDDVNKQMELLEEKNKSMEEELQEMQERYLDISLKFAEVEGERQQLIMKLRNLTNANKSS